MNPKQTTENEEDQENFEEVNNIKVVSFKGKKGQYNAEARITNIQLFRKAEDLFKDKTSQNQIGKPVYRILFLVSGDIPEGMTSEGNSIISKTTGKSKKSKLYLYKERYGDYPSVGDNVKVENDTEGFWQLII